MARYSKTLTPAAELAFLLALKGGAPVVGAAAAAGVAVSTLYCRRKRDARFDAAWREAAETSWHEEMRVPAGDGPPVLVRTARRARFSAELKAEYLGLLEKSCNTKRSAREAAVHPSTIYRHLKRDPGFARDHEAALARGYVYLGRLDREWRTARGERLARFEPPPGLRPTADFDRQMRLLDRYWRPDKPRRGPPRRRESFEELLDALEISLERRFGKGARRGAADEAGATAPSS